MNDNLKKLQELVDSSENIVFFGGAGVSCESGIPDFRGADGLYLQKYKYPPEEILSREFFFSNTEDFFDFYKKKMIYKDAKPNDAHKKLAELEKAGKLRAVITQNIDGLHQAAGSEQVVELHGSVLDNICLECSMSYDVDMVIKSSGVPICPVCGGVVKPKVVLYGEPLDNKVVTRAIYEVSHADLLIIGGTSLTVHPAASIIDYYYGDEIVVINKSGAGTSRATLEIKEPIGEVLSKITV